MDGFEKGEVRREPGSALRGFGGLESRVGEVALLETEVDGHCGSAFQAFAALKPSLNGRACGVVSGVTEGEEDEVGLDEKVGLGVRVGLGVGDEVFVALGVGELVRVLVADVVAVGVG